MVSNKSVGRFFLLEWPYLSQEARSHVVTLLTERGVKSVELAMEIAIIELGEERAFDLSEEIL
jgi:hypothetical protein